MLSVGGDQRLQAAVLALRVARRDVRNDIGRATRAVMSPVWKAELDSAATRPGDRAVLLPGARIAAGNPPAALAAQSKRRLRGGLVPVENWQAWEFGADREKVATYRRTAPGGRSHTVTRHTARQLPARRPQGRVVYPTLKRVVPRMVSLWLSVIVKRFNDELEKG